MNLELRNFIIDQSGVTEQEVTEDALLEDDLGIYGDDAMELLIAYSKKFNVDVSNFMAAEYFKPEGDWILPALLRFFLNDRKPQRKKLTVFHLEKGINAGRLNEDIINNPTPKNSKAS